MNAVSGLTGYNTARTPSPSRVAAQPSRQIVPEERTDPTALVEVVKDQVNHTVRELILANFKGAAAQLAMLQAIPWLGPKIIEWLDGIAYKAANKILGQQSKPLERVVSRIMNEPENLLDESQDLLLSFWGNEKMTGVRDLQKNPKDLLNPQKVLDAMRSVFGREFLNYPWLNGSMKAVAKFLEVPEQKALEALPKFKQILFKLPKPAKIVGLALAGAVALKIVLKLIAWLLRLATTAFAAVTGFKFFKKHLGAAAAQDNKPGGGGLLDRIKAVFNSDKARKAMDMAKQVANGAASGNPAGAALNALSGLTNNPALSGLANLAGAAGGGNAPNNPLGALAGLLGGAAPKT